MAQKEIPIEDLPYVSCEITLGTFAVFCGGRFIESFGHIDTAERRRDELNYAFKMGVFIGRKRKVK